MQGQKEESELEYCKAARVDVADSFSLRTWDELSWLEQGTNNAKIAGLIPVWAKIWTW